MPGGLPPFRITVGNTDFSYEAENIMFSNVDPGGYEICTFDLQSERADLIYPGDRVRVMEGASIVWEGRVSEPQKTIAHGWHVHRKVGSAITRVSAEGYGAVLKDNNMSMVYVDRDLSRWTQPSTQRQINDTGNNNPLSGSWQITADPTNGMPAIVQTFPEAWASPQEPWVESWYDAGPNNLVSVIYYNSLTSAQIWGSINMQAIVAFCSDAVATIPETTTNVASNTGSAGYYQPATPYRYGLLIIQSTTTPQGTAGSGKQYNQYWRNPAVYGNHGLTRRGADPGGFYTSDIAQHAAQQAISAGTKMKIGQVDAISNYVVPHYVQYLPVTHETIISDMAKQGYAHYGVWESSSIFDDLPEFTFRQYGTQADFICSLSDCDEADLSERLANLYTTASITYQDAAGSQFLTTVSLPNAVLSKNSISRTVNFDLGLSSSTAASVFAGYVLQILFAQGRSAGQVQLPKKIRDRKGALTPAYRLKAGIHRLRITDAPTRAGLLTSSDTDSFRISRVENNVDTTSGQVTTRVELDAGPNLIETLQARMDVVQTLANL